MRIHSASLQVCLFGWLAAGCIAAPRPVHAAHAGEWRFYPERCPDLVEDWCARCEDRADRLESRRDERVTACPASAWRWHGPAHYRTTRPAAPVVYYDWRAHHDYRYGPDRGRIRIVVR